MVVGTCSQRSKFKLVIAMWKGYSTKVESMSAIEVAMINFDSQKDAESYYSMNLMVGMRYFNSTCRLPEWMGFNLVVNITVEEWEGKLFFRLILDQELYPPLSATQHQLIS